MKTFLAVLSNRRAAAIQHIVLAHPGQEFDVRPARTVQCRLKGLKTLVFFGHISLDEHGAISIGPGTQKREACSLRALRTVPSQGTALIVLFRGGRSSEMPTNVPLKLLCRVSQWATSIGDDLNKPILELFYMVVGLARQIHSTETSVRGPRKIISKAWPLQETVHGLKDSGLVKGRA